MSLEGFFAGLALIILGFTCVMFSRSLAESIAAPLFVSRFFGPGREDAFYKFFGILLILAGFATMIGLHNYIINVIFSPFTRLIN